MKVALLLVLLAAPGLASAQSALHETRAVAADARIDISNVKGSVTVQGWDRAEVEISGTLGKNAQALKIEGDAAHLRIEVQGPADKGWFNWRSDTLMGDTELQLKVPRQAALEIDSVSADISLDKVDGASLDVDSVSGKLRLDSGAKKIEIDSVSGTVELTASAADTHVETVSGNIRTRGLSGKITLETVSGDIDADSNGYSSLEASSVSGSIRLRGTPADEPRFSVNTMSGDVQLQLPEATSAQLEASSFSGRIRSDFGNVDENELKVRLGDGRGKVEVETFSGDIEIRKQ